MRRNIFLISLLISIIFSNNIKAESLFSFQGYGEKVKFINTFNSGMGNTGLSFYREDMPNINNSAINAFLPATSYIINWEFEIKNIEMKNKNYYLRNSHFPSFHLSFPFTNVKMATGFGFKHINNLNSKIKIPVDSLGYEKQIREGGLYCATLELSKGFEYEYGIGINLNYYFGQDDETYLLEFNSHDFTNSEYYSEGSHKGIGFGFSFVGFASDFNYAIVYNSKVKMTKDQYIKNYFTNIKNIKTKWDYPDQFKIGITHRLSSKSSINFDFEVENKKNASFINYKGNLENGISFGIGYNRRFTKFSQDWLDKFGFSAGYNYTKDMILTNGKAVETHYLTIGVEKYLPLNGIIGCAFIVGFNDNSVEKSNIYKFMVSLNDFEKWSKRIVK